MDFETPKQLEAAFRELQPWFDGKETEQNWQQREKSVAKLRKITAGQAPNEFTHAYLAGIKSMLDGILKTVNSLRTTLSTAGCSLVQDIANASGPGIDNMVEILLQNFVKLCANTKPIARTNANEAVLAILSNASYHNRIAYHVHSASQDKNTYPRRFACVWLKKVIKKHPRNIIEHAGGLDLLEKSLKGGLLDKDKDVRDAMRPTFWAFVRRWPEKSDGIMSGLDKIKQDQLLADESNPNRVPSGPNADLPEQQSLFSKSTSAVSSGKPSLKEIKAQLAAQKKAELMRSRPASAQEVTHRSIEDLSPSKKKSMATLVDHKSTFSKSTNLAPNGKSTKEMKPRVAVQKKIPSQSAAIGSHSYTATSHSTQSSEIHEERAANTPDDRIGESQDSMQGHTSKPTLRDVKAKLGAYKRTFDANQTPAAEGSRAQLGLDSTHSPEKPRLMDYSKSRPLASNSAHVLSPGGKGANLDDVATFTSLGQRTQPRNLNAVNERPRSADAPTPGLARQASSNSIKFGNLASAPMRPRRKAPMMKKTNSEPLNSMPTDLRESLDLATRSDLKPPTELSKEDEDPEDGLETGTTITETAVHPEAEVFKTHESFDAVKHSSQMDKIESPLHCQKLLESAQVRIQARSLDIHGFRKLQNLIREQKSNSAIWQDGYKVSELLLPLLDWLESPLVDLPTTDFNHALDLHKQILSTIRLLLKHHRQYARASYPHTLSTLLVAREHFNEKEHIVSGIEDAISEIVIHCNPKECIGTICDMIEHDLGTRAYELALHTLSSLLHRLHSAPKDGGLGQKLVPGDNDLAQRIGRITTALLEDQDLVTRRAAIEVAMEFYDCVAEEDFFQLVTRKDESHKNVLIYYLSRHKKAHDPS